MSNNPTIEGTSPADRRELLSLGYEPIILQGKRCLFDKWTALEITPEQLDRWERQNGTDENYRNTGLRTGKLCVADIDLWNPEHAAAVSDAIQESIGLTMFERIGQKGMALLYFNKHPISKVEVTGLPPDNGPDDKRQKIEFLGSGQQLACFGIHPDIQKPYRWPNSSPLDSNLIDLPKVTPDDIHKAAHAVLKTLAELGYTELKISGRGMDDTQKVRPRGDIEPITSEMLTAMFAAIANPMKPVGPIDSNCGLGDWIKWMCIIKYTPLVDLETGEPDENFNRFDFFHDWSVDRQNYKGIHDCYHHWTSKTAEDSRMDGATVASLVHAATDAGYSGPTYISAIEPVPETPAVERLRIVQDNDETPDLEDSDDENFWLSFEEFSARDKVTEFIISEWLIAHGITGIIASRGTGKSTIALDIACHVACDMDWWELPTMKGWCVIYLCCEDQEGMTLNARAWTKHHGVAPANNRMLMSANALSLTEESVLTRRLKEMTAWAQGRRCLIILDTWQRATAGLKSNAQEEMEIAVKRAETVADRLNGPMLVLQHPPKDGRMTVRGSAVQEDTSSGLWNLEKVADGIKLTVQRAKGPGEGNWRKFKIHQIQVAGQDVHGKPLHGIVPVKIAGTEDDSIAQKTITELQREAWAWMIRHIRDWKMTADGDDKLPMTRKSIAAHAEKEMQNRDSYLYRQWSEMAASAELTSLSRSTIERALADNFDASPARAVHFHFADRIVLRIEMRGKSVHHRVIAAPDSRAN